jgi:phosphopantothenoylcysteine decarboxylase/phosphopantothenate--cysteine ligase
MARGIADNLLSTLYLSFKGTTCVAPAMNEAMLDHPAVQENIEVLKGHGVLVIDPEFGELACGESGKGRMPSPERLLSWTVKAVSKQVLSNKRVLITAGPTREYLDPVRFIGNASSGKMGHALARAAWQLGASVTLVSGPSFEQALPEITKREVTSAAEMFAAVKEEFGSHDLFIANAAVADMTPLDKKTGKVKKERLGDQLKLRPTDDILAWAGHHKKRQIVIGFALETANEIKNARIKLKKKGCDYIIMNNPLRDSSGIGGEDNAALIIAAHGVKKKFPNQKKEQLAHNLLSFLCKS